MAQTAEERRAYQREYQRAWRARNREKVLAMGRKSRDKNRDKANERKRAWRQQNPEKAREQDRAERARDPWRQHAQFSGEDYAAMLEAQDGKCYLCGEPMDKNIRIDHDYSCCPRNASCAVCRRGLTHHRCNIMIGHAGEDPARLRRAADALERAQAEVTQRKVALAMRTGEQLALSDIRLK